MKPRRDEAYVLRTRELGESDLIVSLFAREHGKVRGVARAARRSRRRFGGLLEPLTLVRVGWTEKPGRELHRIESMDGIRSYAAMQAEPANQATCAVISELTDAFAHEGQADAQAFRLVGAVLDALEQGCATWVLVRYFEYWMLRIHGLVPEVAACASCGREISGRQARRVDAHGSVRCASCSGIDEVHELALGARELDFLESARHAPPAEMSAERSTVRPGGALEALLRGTLESFAEKRFRAYRHLRAASPPPDGAGAR